MLANAFVIIGSGERSGGAGEDATRFDRLLSDCRRPPKLFSIKVRRAQISRVAVFRLEFSSEPARMSRLDDTTSPDRRPSRGVEKYSDQVEPPASPHRRRASRGDRLSEQRPPGHQQMRLRHRPEADRVSARHPGAVQREVTTNDGQRVTDERDQPSRRRRRVASPRALRRLTPAGS